MGRWPQDARAGRGKAEGSPAPRATGDGVGILRDVPPGAQELGYLSSSLHLSLLRAALGC